MLKQRIITAVLLLLVFLPALFSSQPEWLGCIGLLLIIAAAWEWGRLNALGFLQSFTLSICCLAIGLSLWTFEFAGRQSIWFWFSLSVFWMFITAYFFRNGIHSWTKIHFFIRNCVGVVLLTGTGLAFYQAKLIGTSFLASILLLVWIADIAAFFSGRRWGKNKLAPHISPGKSLEGLLGGIFAVWLLAFVWMAMADFFPQMKDSIFNRLSVHGWLVMLAGLTFLTVMSAMGDLFESLIKRSAGKKDSSQLLPGHGGVLDRLDALLPVLPLAVLISSFQAL
jgi:phosphatidate cytidylyltransferase